MPYHVRLLTGPIDRRAGSHVYHMEMVHRLAARGHRVSVVCFSATPAEKAAASVVEIPPGEFTKKRLVWRLASYLQRRQCARLLNRAGLDEPDVVIAGEHLFLKPHARRFPRTPWVYLAHSLLVAHEIDSYGYPPLMRWLSRRMYVGLQRWALQRADRTLRFTQHACAAIRTYYPDLQPHFFVNPIGVHSPLVLVRSEKQGPVRLLWVGQLIARKRIDVALDALAGLRHLDWVFDVVGDGNCRSKLEALAAEKGLTERVRFHGFQSNPSMWYDRADLLLFPSWFENFPVTMLEAMAHGVPCLAMRADGVRFFNANAEMMEDGVEGFLADSDADFGRMLGDLLVNPERLQAVGAAARRTVQSRLTWENHLDRFDALFDELIAERTGG